MNTHYRHFRDLLLQKTYTYCGVVSNKGHLLIGLAILNPKDVFVKAIGREQSYAHAHTQPVAELVIPEGVYAGHVFHEFANNFLPLNTFHTKIYLDDILDSFV